jgi:hypothetical protein
VHPLAIQGDHLGGDALPHPVVDGHLDHRRVFGHRPGLDPLIVVEPGQVRHKALDDEQPARIKHARHTGEALCLPRLAEQAEQRIEHQVHQPEPAADRHLSHVAHGDRDRLPARLGPQPLHHRSRGINPLHRDPPGRQRQRHPPGPDSQLQHPPVPGQAGQELHRGRRVRMPVVVVISGRPAIAIEPGVVESGHARHSTTHRPPAPHIHWARHPRRPIWRAPYVAR